jgi:hypothetical protein
MSDKHASPSLWERPRAGFTAFMQKAFGEFITADTADGIRILQERAAMLSTLEGIRQAKARKEIRHANVVSRN